MFIYYFIFIIAFFLCALDYTTNRYLKLTFYVIFCAILIAFPALKSIGVDNDGWTYDEIFKMANTYSFSEILLGNYWENIERGYMLLNKIIGYFGGTVNSVFFIVAFLTGLINYTIFYKKTPFPFSTLLFYLSFFYLYRDFTQIRYGLSCALVFLSVYHLLEKRYIWCLLFLLFALTFHNSAAIMLVAIPLCFLIRNKYIYLLLPFISLVGLFYNPFPLLLALTGGSSHMEIYLGETGGAGFIVSAVGVVILSIYFFYKSKFNDQNTAIYFRLLMLGVAMNFLFFQTSIFQRFSYMLFQFGLLLLPAMIYVLEKSKDKYVFVLFHFLCNCFFLYYGFKLIAPTLIRPYF